VLLLLKFPKLIADTTCMKLSGAGFELLTQVMNAASLRHKVISQNIANVNTPGYHRLEVTFEDEMAKALAHPTAGSAPVVKPHVVIADGPERVDGNTVDIDKEMGDLTANSLLFEAAAQIITSRISSYKAAIAGR
jgi:flagellar basal-body rod protein FlgB